jgi:hypothetical protein
VTPVQTADELDHVSFYREADPIVTDTNTVDTARTANPLDIRHLVQRPGRFDSFDDFAYPAQ